MDTAHVTVVHRTAEGWECVDDHGRRVTLPADAVDPALHGLRVGQRLKVTTEVDGDGAAVHATLP